MKKELNNINTFMNHDIPIQTPKGSVVPTPLNSSTFVNGVQTMINNNHPIEHLDNYLDNFKDNSSLEFSTLNRDQFGRILQNK